MRHKQPMRTQPKNKYGKLSTWAAYFAYCCSTQLGGLQYAHGGGGSGGLRGDPGGPGGALGCMGARQTRIRVRANNF